MPPKDEDRDAEVSRLRDTVRQWRAEALRDGKPLRLPMMPFLLRNIWTGALLLFTILTFSTLFISTVAQVRYLISCGLVFLVTESCLGKCCGWFDWDMLGSGMLGAVCYYHGGRYLVMLHVEPSPHFFFIVFEGTR
jgi:hypothetical protein